MADIAKALNKTPTKTLLKLSYIATSLDREASWCAEEAKTDPSGFASTRFRAKASAYKDVAKVLWDLIEEIESEQ